MTEPQETSMEPKNPPLDVPARGPIAEPLPAEIPPAPVETVAETPQAVEPPAVAETAPIEVEISAPAPEPALQTSTTAPAHSPPVPISNWKTEYQRRGLQAQKQKVEQLLEKILARTREKGTIKNSDVVKLLRVSDATASRYLKLLVSRGQLVQQGKGRSISYSVS